MIKEFITKSQEETIDLARCLGELLEGGEVLALEGELGAGKTHFVKGLALGLNIAEAVTSPTFNLIHEYMGGRLPLFHFDVYRLDKPDQLENLGYEEYFYGQGITVVEWSGIIKEYLPEEYLHIQIQALENGLKRRILIEAIGTALESKLIKLEGGEDSLC